MRFVLAVLFSLACAGPSFALSYQLVPLDDGRCGYTQTCEVVVRATGRVEADEFERFTRFLDTAKGQANLSRTLVIQSPGGHMLPSIKVGMALRALNFTVVPGVVQGGEIRRGVCGSACVFIFMGGARRPVPAGSVVAIHSPKLVTMARLDPEPTPVEMTSDDVRDVTRGLSQYSTLMGIDPGLITLMMRVPHTTRHVLTAAEMRRFRLATGPYRR